ncbi:unnamed protein product [Boreogadus saida]
MTEPSGGPTRLRQATDFILHHHTTLPVTHPGPPRYSSGGVGRPTAPYTTTGFPPPLYYYTWPSTTKTTRVTPPPNASQHLDYTHCWSSTNTTQRLPEPRLHPLLVQHHPTPPSP